ncbi:hypothetical protein M5K25_008277 [Dendrobium thyrsiflorum]|uniref:RNase H type-1 domain-containing protein n=1 Tax=Dendrobium thyrsiflorum TaxID=117978 RepID=A0ABD0V898_DENTH
MDVLFVGIVEMKISVLDRVEFNKILGVEWDFFINPFDGMSGRIMVIWRSNLASFSVLHASSQCVVGDLNVFKKEVWMISTVYGSKEIIPELDQDRVELISKFSGKTIVAMVSEALVEDDKVDVYWKWVRRLKLISRVELLFLRLCENAIPSNEFLVHRRLFDNNLCPKGCLAIENSDHIAADCVKLLQIIEVLNAWGFPLPVFVSFAECKAELERVGIKVKHGGVEDSPAFIASNVITVVTSSNQYNLISEHWGVNQLPKLFCNLWHPPPPYWIKVNIDDSLLRSNKAGVGGVYRDDKGRFLLAFGFKCVHWDIAKVELLAISSLKSVVQSWMLEVKALSLKIKSVDWEQLRANLEEAVEEEDSRNLGFPAATAKKVRDLGYLAAAMEDEALHLAFLVAVAEKKEMRELVFPAAAAMEGEAKGHGFPAATLEKEGVGGFGSPVAAL